jgi:UDP-glucose 4-epimerase
LFLDQIAKGGPVTITLDRMTRFLLTLDRAVDTIFAALVTGDAGDTYIPKIPAAYVKDIARALIGARDITIKLIGIRPGEKVDEIMVSEEEVFRTADRGDYYVIRPILPELGGEGVLAARTTEYSSREVTLDVQGIRALLARAAEHEDSRSAF